MSEKTRAWITWALTTIAIILAGIAAQRPITIPPLPIPGPTEPGQPPPIPEEQPAKNPADAVVKIGRANVGCSATFIHPRRSDGRYWVLTAAHCCDQIGERWVARFRDGRQTGIVITALDRNADFAWGLSDSNRDYFPCVKIATRDPEPATKVFHVGFGIDKPGNREDGEVRSGRNDKGQIEYFLSVSSGDSGGGILANESGEVISPVCCTTRLSGPGRVWGASPVVALRGQTVAASAEDYPPLPMPVVPETGPKLPLPMPSLRDLEREKKGKGK